MGLHYGEDVSLASRPWVQRLLLLCGKMIRYLAGVRLPAVWDCALKNCLV